MCIIQYKCERQRAGRERFHAMQCAFVKATCIVAFKDDDES